MWRLFLLALFITFVSEEIAGQECGRIRSSVRLTGKIVGGYDVGYYKYPWFAALLLDGTPWCGGTLIGENAVVTAAHCYKKYMKQPGAKLEDVFTVLMGVYSSCKKEESQKKFKVKKVIYHEKYLKNDPYYDIAIVILDGDSSQFEPACLPPKVMKDADRGKEGYIIGLGTMNFSKDSYPCNLYEGRILLYDDKTCKEMIKHTTQDKEDYPMTNALCAGYKTGGVDACQGDSGGPLMIIEQGGRYILEGLTSFGYECAVKGQMGIYTDVSKYLDWIEEKAGVKSRLIETTTSEMPTPMPTSANNQPANGGGNLQFNVSDYLPAYNRPPLVYQEVPQYPNGGMQGYYPNYYPGYVQQINNNNPYEQIQQLMHNRPPKKIVIQFKKRRKNLGNRRKGYPHRRHYILRNHPQRSRNTAQKSGLSRSKDENIKNSKKTDLSKNIGETKPVKKIAVSKNKVETKPVMKTALSKNAGEKISTKNTEKNS